jgi:hypothetical protein
MAISSYFSSFFIVLCVVCEENESGSYFLVLFLVLEFFWELCFGVCDKCS